MGTISNINVRVGADASPLSEEMKKAQNTILTFKNESMTALKSFGIPHINSTNLVESIQSGQRVVVDFTRNAGESLAQFQQRVRTAFEEAKVDITAYEQVLQNAGQVHAEFAKGAVKSFQAVNDASKDMSQNVTGGFAGIGTGIRKNITDFTGNVSNAFNTMKDDSASFGAKLDSVSQVVSSGFGLMTGAVEVFLAVEVVKTVAGWLDSLEQLAAKAEDTQHRFIASTGVMSDKASEFSKNLSNTYKVGLGQIKNEMGTEYLNTRMLGFSPEQSEQMSESLVKLSYDLGKLRGEDPSQVFNSLKMGVEGQTKGLSELGLRITNADIQNKALAEGLIKHGQVLNDQTKSLVIYQEIMQKTAGVQGYYATTTNDISTQTEKLNAGWSAMKTHLAQSLTPAFEGFLKVVNWVATGIEDIVNVLATAIQYVSLFAEDAYSAVNDILNLDFGKISTDWANNYNSIFNSSEAAKQFGQSLDKATDASNAQDAAQQNLNKTLNANIMSFDQVHNLTNAATIGALAQADAVNNLANALGNLKSPSMNNLNNQSKGIVIPIAFGPMPPFPKLPSPPAVAVTLQNKLEPTYSQVENLLKAFAPTSIDVKLSLTDGISPALAIIKANVSTWIDTVQKLISTWQNNTISSFNQVQTAGSNLESAIEKNFIGAGNSISQLENSISSWKANTISSLNTVSSNASSWETNTAKSFNNAQNAISEWKSNTVSDFNVFSTQLTKEVGSAVNSADQMITSFVNAASQDFATLDANVGTAVSTFSAEFHNDFNEVLSSTESMVVSWANSVGQEFVSTMNQAISSLDSLAVAAGQTITHTASNVWQSVTGTYDNVKNWVADNKSWIVPTLAVTAVVGATVATGGLDLLGAGGVAAVAALATGGIVTAPTLAMVGEGGGPEAVIPLDQIDRVLNSSRNGSTGNADRNSSQPIILNANLQVDGRTFARITRQYNVNENDRVGRIQGYDPTYNYPK